MHLGQEHIEEIAHPLNPTRNNVLRVNLPNGLRRMSLTDIHVISGAFLFPYLEML